MTFWTTHIQPFLPLAPKLLNFKTQIPVFCLIHAVAVVRHAQVLQNVYTTCLQSVASIWDKGACKPKLAPTAYFCKRWS